VKSILDQDYLYGDNANEMVVFIDNHDRNRFLTEAGGNVAKLQNALTFLFTVRGIPCVFQGTEQNKGNTYNDLMVGMADTWNRWSMVEKDNNGTVVNDHFNTSTNTYQLVAQLSSLKDQYPALSFGTQREMWASPNIYAFSRRIDSGVDAGSEIICAFNNANTSMSAFMPLRTESTIAPGTVLENVFDPSDRITVSTSSKIAITLAGNSNKIYKVSSNQVKTTVPVTFMVYNATTSLGQNVYIAGNVAALGNWDPNLAAGPGNCPTYPMWSVTANLPPGLAIEFKAIKSNTSGTDWESISNRTYTVPIDGGSIAFDWSVAGLTTMIPVKFTVNSAPTLWGENVYISGNTTVLGNWSPDFASGPALCPNYPSWEIYIDVPAGSVIEWKALKKGANTATVWQQGSNNVYSVPNSGVGATSTIWS